MNSVHDRQLHLWRTVLIQSAKDFVAQVHCLQNLQDLNEQAQLERHFDNLSKKY